MNEAKQSIGERLRRSRESRGLSLHDVARGTKLSIDVLRAIEGDRLDRLPAGMYRKAYLRTLAIEVGVDPDDIAAQYSSMIEPPRDIADDDVGILRPAGQVEQLTEWSRRPEPTLALFVVLAAAWFTLQSRLYPAVSAPPDFVADIAAAPVPLEASSFRSAALLPAAITSNLSSRAVRIELHASDRCWVAAEADGRRVVYRLVQPGERFTLEADRLISIRLGNAGSVMLSINGGERRLAGRGGEVVQFEVTAELTTLGIEL